MRGRAKGYHIRGTRPLAIMPSADQVPVKSLTSPR